MREDERHDNDAVGGGWLRRTGIVLLVAGFLLGVLLLLFGLNMRRSLNHDEHQFVTASALIARQGLLPYVDFPYFHVPTQALAVALIYRFTDALLWGARLFSIAAGWLTLVLVFGIGLTLLAQWRLSVRLLAAALSVLLLMTTASFLHASGRAWNHDFPVVLTLAAAWIHVTLLTRRKWSGMWLVVGGVLLGLAVSSRISYVVLLPPFLLATLWRAPWRDLRSWGPPLWFGLGVLIGSLPMLVLFGLAPRQFIYGNFTYAMLNTRYYREFGSADVAMTVWAKALKTMQYLVTEPGNLAALLVTLFALWRARVALSLRTTPALLFMLLLLPFHLAGAFAPSPIQPQYLYVLFPTLTVIVLLALARDARPVWTLRLLAFAVVISAGFAAQKYGEGAAIIFDRNEWLPLKLHSRGEFLAQLVNHGRVLTLAPILPLEGGSPIYTELSTGPLAWRTAPLVAPEVRRQAGVFGADDLDAVMAAQPARAIFTGLHDNDQNVEAPLVTYAQAHGFVPIAMPEAGVLWMAPRHTWAEQIRLGAALLPDAPLRPGDHALLTLYLQALQPIADNLNVLVRVVGADGSELMRSEGWPWGRPTSTWAVGEVWPDGHDLELPATAAAGVYRVDVSFYDPATLEHLGDDAVVGYLVLRTSESAPVAQPLAQFGDGIALLAADVAGAGWLPGATQQIRLSWQAQTPSRGRYTAFLHLVGPDGALVAQHDQEPLQGFYPTNSWLTGVAVDDLFELALPDSLPSGRYQLSVGLYDPLTMQRLPVLESGVASRDAHLLTTIEITH